MSIFAAILIIIGFVALICGLMAVTFIFIGYVEELNLANRLYEYGAKLARRRKGRKMMTQP